ncbi:tetratricopeptide repeat protein [Treponema phagedenis]|uniref:tetratricopeptide repeat protein n=1 Tax=Treponema phagedenis TaxID=162 RepID=UPI0015A63A23|nr:tetratricopeptide repeat protein [Treponema phagedenis]NVP25690.1 tetratricopeptide repeat protein [Treponema phagedenis]
MKKAAQIKSKDSADYANFALASTYLMQDEIDAANDRLKKISDPEDKKLQAAILYQSGIIAYRKKHYQQAVSFFKQCLELEPFASDSKINYEISKRAAEQNETITEKETTRSLSIETKINAEEKYHINYYTRKGGRGMEKEKSTRIQTARKRLLIFLGLLLFFPLTILFPDEAYALFLLTNTIQKGAPFKIGIRISKQFTIYKIDADSDFLIENLPKSAERIAVDSMTGAKGKEITYTYVFHSAGEFTIGPVFIKSKN